MSAAAYAAPDWAKVCCFCHSRPRARRDMRMTLGFCFDLECQAERAVANAVRRQEAAAAR
jgi:hypothetical protein